MIYNYKLHFRLLGYSFSGLFLLFLFIQCQGSQRSQLPEYQAENSAVQMETEGLLWSISKKGEQDTSYLFGTIHMIPKEYYFLPAGTAEALAAVDKVIFEVDMSLVNDPVQQMAMMQKSMMKGDVSLSDLLSEKDYMMVKDHFQELGIPFFLLEKIKPIFLSVFADETMFQGGDPMASMKYYEMEFFNEAEAAGKEIGGLESIDYQLSVMDSIPYQEQADMLVESIRMENENESAMDTLFQLYREQKLDALLQSFSTDSLSTYDSLLLINRNHNWIPVMKEYMKDGPCFFAVGAAHLPGQDGVIHLLRKQGYKLEVVRED